METHTRPGEGRSLLIQLGRDFIQLGCNFIQPGCNFIQPGCDFIQLGHDFIQLGCNFIQLGCDFIQLGCDFIQLGCNFIQLGCDFIQPGCDFIQLGCDFIQLGCDFIALQPSVSPAPAALATHLQRLPLYIGAPCKRRKGGRGAPAPAPAAGRCQSPPDDLQKEGGKEDVFMREGRGEDSPQLQLQLSNVMVKETRLRWLGHAARHLDNSMVK